jgi:uncharacterized protein (TIGR02679 family)
MIHDLARLCTLLGRPELEGLLGRLERRLRLGQPLTGIITLADPDPPERSAIDQLMGRPPSSGETLSVNLDQLERTLREAGLCDDLPEAVEAIIGQTPNERAQRLAVAAQWEALFASLRAALEPLPQYLPWLDKLAAAGQLKRLSRSEPAIARVLVEQAIAVLSQLPQPLMPLPELAAKITGDSHALDAGQPLSSLCLGAICADLGLARPATAQERRRTWEAVGVALDELSAPVLALNLRFEGESPLARFLNAMADIAEPCYLTLRQLRGSAGAIAPVVAGADVFICENPAIVAAATHRLGRRSAPLVCISGQPASAARLLLTRLSEAGARLRYHGDFDWPGLHIANLLHRRHNVSAWRMSVADYTAAARPGTPLRGRPVEADWDANLANAMRKRGVAVLEESVVDQLLADLAMA